MTECAHADSRSCYILQKGGDFGGNELLPVNLALRRIFVCLLGESLLLLPLLLAKASCESLGH